MTKLFISYANSDRPKVASLAHALGQAGFDVWWDRELIGGQDFAEVIETQIRDADVVIVVWSRKSIASQWVRAEAQKAGKKLLPIRLESVEPPAPFNTLHTLDIDGGNLTDLVAHVTARLEGTSIASAQHHARPGWTVATFAVLGVFLVGGVALYNGVPGPLTRLLTPSTVESVSASRPEAFDAHVASFQTNPEGGRFAAFLKTKLERNFVELLSRKGLKVGHAIAAAGPGDGAAHVVNGSIVKTPTGWTVSADITANGIQIAGASLDAPESLLNETYRSIPEALLYAMKLDSKLNPAPPAKTVTHSTEAYLTFLGARERVKRRQEIAGLALLDQAIAFDPNFAAAIWSKGDLLVRRGDSEAGEALKLAARQIDPDHARIPLLPNSAKPLPAIFAAASRADWETLQPGIAQRQIEARAYGIQITAWSINQSAYAVEVIQGENAQGATATELRSKTEAPLVVNGGFFDMDSESRLTPSGLLVIDGQILNDVQPHAGSGVLITRAGRVFVEKTKDFVLPSDTVSGLQSGPLLVDPGGALGIYSNDQNRVPRTAVCLAGDEVVIVVVQGGLSLYELGKILVTGSEQGGFGCERALNLDGGPSTQASLAVGDETFELTGQWNMLTAIRVGPR